LPSVRLPALPSLREIIRIYGLRAEKHLSQNFLLQPSSINSLVKCAGSLQDACVLEVGPGPGSLTRAILRQRPRHLVVVELDRRFLPALQELQVSAAELGVHMDIYRGDILKMNTEDIFPVDAVYWPERWGSGVEKSETDSERKDRPASADSTALTETSDSPTPRPPRIRILGNLPFNISTPLLIKWLENIATRRQLWKLGRVPMTLTFQKEICERLTADVWSEQRSRLSIMAQAYCEVKFLKEIPGSAFVPKPKVDAGVVRLRPLAQPLISVPFPYVEKLVRHAFHFRQKFIVRCLETLFPPDRPDLVFQLFKEAAVQPMKRPIQLSNLEFRDLCEVYARICQKNENVFQYDYQSPSNLASWHSRKKTQTEIMGHSLTADAVRKELYR
uniref:rRNA adenine N(6)-methyltransferase n=2 Tax=Schistocephalus solidus TaxID=70667 RepID=A0A183TC40_SCHSO